ncbi:NAD(P)/FAD-dependent oxidoreductase [Halorussus marinus]|uniref:NAD(P)/FAD-dependent oxidoreductase n=1 Tax=Halorussus marinus TaxID=2505976 RepID=UPI001091BEB1|nr:NAD(P)/FAD-dependent oxidoreductase [Halorussus marinus]
MTTSSDDADRAAYDVAVVGGGPAGLTTALYATRLGHETAVFDRGGGRAAMMRDTHNVVGVPESVSGNEFLRTAIDQLEGYGASYERAFVTGIDEADSSRRFELETTDGTAFADRIVLATGLGDGRPDPPLARTGRGLHYCLHCDAYMFVDEPVYVMGAGESAARVAMIMLNFTDDVDLLLRGDDPEWSGETDRQLRAHPVDIVESDVVGVTNGEDGWLESLAFADGTEREYAGGFAMYGADYNNDLAASLGVEIDDDGAVVVDDHGRTSRDGVYAVGDLTPGHNQIPVAMGQGAKAGLAIHKDLRTYPKPLSEIDGEVEPTDVPAMPESLRSRAASRADADD